MATTDRNTAVGVFTDFTHAEQAIEALRSAGFPSDRIGFIADEPAKVETPAVEHGTQAGKGAVVGAALGVAVGLAVAAVVLPVAGPVIVGGLLAGVLGGAVTGGTSGGILGALIGLNVPEEEARRCEQQFHSGRALVTVHAGDRYEEAVAILRRVAEQPDHHHTRPPTYDLSGESGLADGDGGVYVPRP